MAVAESSPLTSSNSSVSGSAASSIRLMPLLPLAVRSRLRTVTAALYFAATLANAIAARICRPFGFRTFTVARSVSSGSWPFSTADSYPSRLFPVPRIVGLADELPHLLATGTCEQLADELVALSHSNDCFQCVQVRPRLIGTGDQEEDHAGVLAVDAVKWDSGPR